jgi:uncharacterized protein YndB with AHSA1/START domain
MHKSMTAETGSRTTTVTLPTDTEILITRTFDAAPHLVYRALTTPELVSRWWPAGLDGVTSIQIDLRVGGAWRYALATDDGTEVALHGEYREIVPRERLVCTEVWDDRPAAEALVTVTLTPADGKTTVSRLAQFHNTQDRDEHLQRMQYGLQAAMALFEQIVLSL